jgi:hypothetical protein
MAKPTTPQEIGREIGREIREGILQAMRQAPQAPQAPQALQIPQEWKPPKAELIPKSGQVEGGEEVKIEFEEGQLYEILSAKFGEIPAQTIEFRPPRTLLVTTPEAAHGRVGKVAVEIETAYHHRFHLDTPYEYVRHAAAPAKASSGAAKVASRTARPLTSPKNKRKMPAKAPFIAASTPAQDDDSALD